MLAISPASPERLMGFRDAIGLRFPLLSDPELHVLQAYGALKRTRDAAGEVHWVVIPATVLLSADAPIVAMNFDNGTDTVSLNDQLTG